MRGIIAIIGLLLLSAGAAFAGWCLCGNAGAASGAFLASGAGLYIDAQRAR